jgi:putative transposase
VAEKKGALTLDQKRALIDPIDPHISIRQQCAWLGLARSSWYFEPQRESEENLQLMRVLDKQYLHTPFYGVRRMTAWLNRQGYEVNEKRVRRLLRLMGIEAIYPKPRLSLPGANDTRYPYLLRDLAIERVNQVWSTDITYVPMPHGFLYLVAVIDWHSRFVLSWELSNTLDTSFCVSALEQALAQAHPEIFNTDQGAQFTSQAYIERLQTAQVHISWDGRGRALDNVFVERLWRTVKYEEIYLHDYQSVAEAARGLTQFFRFYNYERLHQSLQYRTPAEIYLAQ